MELDSFLYQTEAYDICEKARLQVKTEACEQKVDIHVGINSTFIPSNQWPEESTDYDWMDTVCDGLLTGDLSVLETGIAKGLHSVTSFKKSIGSTITKLHRKTIEVATLERFTLVHMAATSGCKKVVLENPSVGTIKRLTDMGQSNYPIELVRGDSGSDAQWHDYVTNIKMVLSELEWDVSLTDKIKEYRSDTFYYFGFHGPRRKREPGKLKHWFWYEMNIGALMYNKGGVTDITRRTDYLEYSQVDRTDTGEYYKTVDRWYWSDRFTRYHFDLLKSKWSRMIKYNYWGYYGINTTADINVKNKFISTKNGMLAGGFVSKKGKIDMQRTLVYVGEKVIGNSFGPLPGCNEYWEPVSTDTGNYFSSSIMWSPYYHSYVNIPDHYCVTRKKKTRGKNKGILLGLYGNWFVVPFKECTHVFRDNLERGYEIVYDEGLGIPPYIDRIDRFETVVDNTHFVSIV